MEQFKEFFPLLTTLLTAFATLLTAILGGGGVFLEWRQRRDERHQRRQARTEATEMVSFVEKWIATQQLACSPEEFEQVKMSAHRQLDRLYNSLLDMQEAKKQVEERSFIQRALLLYKPASVRGWVLHIIFYGLGAIMLLLAVSTFFLLLDPEAAGIPEDVPPNALVLGLMFYYLVLFVPALAIRGWARRVDRRHHKQQINLSAFSPDDLQPDNPPLILLSSDEVEYITPVPTEWPHRLANRNR
jgi:positive regulator of sigma E activity